MKRFWRVSFFSFDPCTPAREEDICNICWRTMQGFCRDCVEDGCLLPYRIDAKYIFTLLHVLQKRRDSVFFGLDKNVLEKIIRYALKPDPEKTTCSIVKLECEHMFHRHCYEKRIQRMPHCWYRCDLDRVPISIKSRIRVPYYIHIEICTENQMNATKKRKIEFEQKKKHIKNIVLMF